MTYAPEDEQPSLFLLQESPRQAILTVFNWTKAPRSRTLKLADLGLPSGHTFSASDVLNQNAPIALTDNSARLDNQLPESVRVIKLIDTSLAPAAPSVQMHVDNVAGTFQMSAQTESSGVPAVGYHWDFGDGTTSTGVKVSHAYTRPGQFNIRLTVDGVDGVPASKTSLVNISNNLRAFPTWPTISASTSPAITNCLHDQNPNRAPPASNSLRRRICRNQKYYSSARALRASPWPLNCRAWAFPFA